MTIESDVEPDGTPGAFSGFPVNGLTHYTAKANIADYQGIKMRPNEGSQAHAIVLDKSAWPGGSGGPVYRIDGRVMGMLLQTASGLAFARHGARINKLLDRAERSIAAASQKSVSRTGNLRAEPSVAVAADRAPTAVPEC